jgi:hypothetical protein
MSVALDEDIIRLSGACRVEDAETLLVVLQFNPGRRVDISDVTHLHAAVVQVLLAFRPKLSGVSPDLFVENWLAPLLRQGTQG